MTSKTTPITSTLMTTVITCVCWMVIVNVTGGLAFDFDCRRFGVDCGQGNCNISDGRCDCSNVSATTTNYKCQSISESTCSENTYGASCALDRVQVDCTGNDMFVNINPDGIFTGSIYVFGKEKVSECHLQEKDSVDVPDYVKNRLDIKGRHLALSYDDQTCGAIGKTEDNSNGTKKTIYTRSYIVRYSKNFRSNLDQKVTVKCVLTEGVTTVVGKVNDIQEGNGNFKDVSVDADADTGVVQFAIKDKNDQEIQSEVTLGDEIKLVFTLTPGRGYADFSLAECTATNTFNDSDSDFRSVSMVKNDCPSIEAQALFQNGVVKASDASIMTVSISAFMFSGSTSKVGFTCDVTLCREENKDDCKKKKCDGITSQADEQEIPEVNFNTTKPASNSSSVMPDEGVENVTSSTNNTEAVTPDNGNDNNTSPANNTETVTSDNGNDNTTSPANNTETETSDNENDNNTLPANNTETVTSDNENDNNTSPANNTIDDPSSTAENTSDSTTTNSNTAPEDNTSGGNNTTPEEDSVNKTTGAAASGPSDDPLRRRRRAAGDEDTSVKRVYSDMTVRDPSAIVEEPVPLPVEKECMEEPEVITVIAILSVIVVTLTLVTLVVICHMIRSGRHKKDLDDDSFSKDSELRTTVDPTNNMFNIPRLEIRAKNQMPYTTT